MKMEKITVNAFCVIGIVGSTNDGEGFVQRLWQQANSRFSEVAGLAKKNADGSFAGFWGAMSDFSMNFQPWEENFTKGIYLAGVEADPEAAAPAGWTKWIVPGFECIKVKADNPATFPDTIAYLKENDLNLVAAVQDYTDPKTGENYMLFPIEWNNSKRELIASIQKKTDPVAPCGFLCNGCFMSEWCGYCRSGCAVCSYATISEDGVCGNARCCKEKGMSGCWECSELTDCKKGFYGSPDGTVCKPNAMFIAKYGRDAYVRFIKEGKANLAKENSVQDNFALMEAAMKNEN